MKDLDDYPGLAYLMQWLRYGEDNYVKQIYRIILKTYIKIGMTIMIKIAKRKRDKR